MVAGSVIYVLRVIHCPNCGKPIKGAVFKGNVHITCPQCNTEYALTQKSIKIHMLIPLICVGISVFLSSTLMIDQTWDMKFIFILLISFSLVYFISILFARLHILKYEIKRTK